MASRRHANPPISENTDEVAALAMTESEDKIANIMQIIETWEYPELLRLRDLIGAEYIRKAEEARATVIAETQRKFAQLGLSFDDVAAMQKKKKRAARTPAVPKYRSPDGNEWVGRGPKPKWIREYEESGGNKEDWLIRHEG